MGEPPGGAQNDGPRYQEGQAQDIPRITDDDGTAVRVVCGTFWGVTGPGDGIAADPIYLDVAVPPGRRKTLPVETTRHAFAYVFGGPGTFGNASGPLAVPTEGVGWADTAPPAEAENRSLVLFDQGDEVTVQAGEAGIRFLLVSGQPLEEPVAWYGPIVMNTQEQLRQAFEELQRGTFLKAEAEGRRPGRRRDVAPPPLGPASLEPLHDLAPLRSSMPEVIDPRQSGRRWQPRQL